MRAAAYQAARTLAAFASLLALSFAQITGLARGNVPPMLRQARLLRIALLTGLVLAGCGKPSFQPTTGEGSSPPGESVGAGAIVTKNTTRLASASAAEDAASVARAVYPGLTTSHPHAVALVDQGDWPAALAASVLAGPPLHAPLLYSEGIALPGVSQQALSALAPTGAPGLGGAQAIRIGESAAPGELRVRSVAGSEPAQLAVAVERLQSELRRRPPRRVIVVASDAPPAMSEPAAGLAALTGAPILFVQRLAIPAATRSELERLGGSTSMYVVGPRSAVSGSVQRQLERLGSVKRIAGAGNDAASNAVAVARFSDGAFGWGALEAGHGFVFASASRPLDGPAAASLAASGDFAPLLLLEDASRIPPPLAEYISDLQPGYPASGPAHGVYNHGWLIGDTQLISATTQAQLDAMLQITPRKMSPEPSAPELETPPPTTTR